MKLIYRLVPVQDNEDLIGDNYLQCLPGALDILRVPMHNRA